jgi:hypothetical protein
MMRHTRIAILVSLFLGAGLPAYAQGSMFWVEGGHQNSTYGDGRTTSGISVGGGVVSVIGGGSSRSSGVIVPIHFDATFTRGVGLDVMTGADVGFRVRWISFGPGVTLGFAARNYAPDARCEEPQPEHTSCYLDASTGAPIRDIGALIGLGLSGYTKVSFGPQGRGFLQVRYIRYPRRTTGFKSGDELGRIVGALTQTPTVAEDAGDETFHPVDYPDYETGHDTRISAGWVFGGGEGHALILRAQYLVKTFDFSHVLANSNGIFDQDTKEFTVGAGITF